MGTEGGAVPSCLDCSCPHSSKGFLPRTKAENHAILGCRDLSDTALPAILLPSAEKKQQVQRGPGTSWRPHSNCNPGSGPLSFSPPHPAKARLPGGCLLSEETPVRSGSAPDSA